jgi:hypothetical protein
VITAATLRVPDSLVELDQWILWRYEPRNDGGKPTKVPFQINGSHASSTDPKTWCSWDEALKACQEKPGHWSGIGFVFSTTDPFFGVDLDQCLDDVGELKPWAQPIMERFFDNAGSRTGDMAIGAGGARREASKEVIIPVRLAPLGSRALTLMNPLRRNPGPRGSFRIQGQLSRDHGERSHAAASFCDSPEC